MQPHRPRPGRPARRGTATRLLLVAALLLTATALQSYAQTASAKPDRRPNIVLITTDDQTLADLASMGRTRRWIGDHGVSFEGISPHPLCCPARAEILTGQFAQNNGVRTNFGKYGGYRRLQTRRTIATWLHDAGYHTIFMGKYLNQYRISGARGPDPGWDDWNPTLRGVYSFHGYTVRHNWRARRHQEYQTDFFTNLAVQKIRAAAGAERPFFLWQSYVAPHVTCPVTQEAESCWRPPVPAARHRDMFAAAVPPSMRSAAFNEADMSDKPFPLARSRPIDEEKEAYLLALHRARLQALQAVDEGVAAMMRALAKTGELDDTLVIFTSDNGYLLGEHRYKGKVLPYEPALQVPLLMRGPGVPTAVVRNRVAATVDIAPTIASVARARPTLVMDGRNLMPLAKGRPGGWQSLLIQAGPYRQRDEANGWFYRGVRTSRYTYAYYLFSDEYELYDRRRDPDELENVADDPRYARVLSALRHRAGILAGCSGSVCRRGFTPLPAPEPLAEPPDEDEPEPSTEPDPEPSPEPDAEPIPEASPVQAQDPGAD